MTTPAISVLLVDDHAVVREGYRRLLELSPDVRVAGEAADATQAYQRFCALQPDVVVMDLALPGASGIEAMRRMLARERPCSFSACTKRRFSCDARLMRAPAVM
jgi:two-component system invasion response regulator UvrY